MTDLDQFKKFFDSMKMPHNIEVMAGDDARALATMTAEPVAAASSKYIIVGSTLFHFDWKGQFIGIESTSFEPREGIDARRCTPPPSEGGGQERGDNRDLQGSGGDNPEGQGSKTADQGD